MKTKITFLTIFLLSFSVMADDHMENPTFFPLEGFACNFNSGKDMDDLLKTTGKWNDYVDSSDLQYSAWIFTPYV